MAIVNFVKQSFLCPKQVESAFCVVNNRLGGKKFMIVVALFPNLTAFYYLPSTARSVIIINEFYRDILHDFGKRV